MDKFIFQHRKINFNDSNGDPCVEASKLRKLAALHYFSALELGEGNDTGCSLLTQDLANYAKVVDDPNGVNNYGDQILKILPNNLSGHQKSWKSSLTTEKVLQLLEPLPCSKDKASNWDKVNCANAVFTTHDLKEYREARRSYSDKKEEKLKRVDVTTLPAPSFVKKQTIPNFQPFVNFGKRKQDAVEPPISSGSRSTGFVPKISIFKKPSPIPSESVGPSRKNVETSDQSQRNPFKTAREELKVQNIKKYGKDCGNEALNCYGTGKKSLGSRKGSSVFNKFQPPILRNEEEERESRSNSQKDSPDEEVDERLKNIDPKMIETIRNEIMDSGPKLSWDDIAGLEFAKNTIQEVVVWPMLRPDIFTGLRRPPRGILLFGPPGTGKTLIGKCIASQSGATFLSISASSLTSKWVGDGEKMVRALFAVARVYQPSVVFIDEIDSLLSQRSDTEHESSRRIKTEFLVQLDGVGTGDEDRILIIGATNRPQELDEAARRRLVKRLYIPLPDPNARAQIVNNLIGNERHTLTEEEVQSVAQMTEGYSGADVKHVCQEASLGPIRSIPPMQIRDINTSEVRAVNIADFKSALVRVKSTVSPDDLHSYVTWDKQFGCGTL